MAQKVRMAVNKAQTPGWVKGVIIFVALTFVASIAGIATLAASGGSGGSTTGGATDVASIGAQYQASIDALDASLKADPENVDLLTQMGHTYYEYAAELTNSGARAAAAPLWTTAISYYDRVLASRPNDAVVLGNKAFASYYSGSAGAKAALEAFIATNDAALAQQITTAKDMLASVASSGATETTTTP